MPLLLVAFAAAFLDFTHITDTHVIQLNGVHPELVKARGMYKPSLGELDKFVGGFGRGGGAFVIHTGDLVDAWCFDAAAGDTPVYGQFETVAASLRRLPVPLYPALGNHDVECYRRNPKDAAKPIGDQTVGDQTRAAWKKQLGGFKKGTYYGFSRKVRGTRYRFLVLDNGQAIPPGSKEFLDRQMAWVTRELRRHPKDKFVLALHIPIGKTPFSDSLRAAVGEASNVVMILCGHNHTDDIARISLGRSNPTQVRTSAMFKGADQWRRIRLHADKIEVSATSKPDTVAETIPVN
jgi:3',5'-cyclic AMP phosphodiesterase CpdA